MDQLEQRYMNKVVYTYIGDILVAVNPFTELNIYGDRVSSSSVGGRDSLLLTSSLQLLTIKQEVNGYRNRAKSDNPPHVFAMADGAYHAMLHQRRSQCIVISGESGAGNSLHNLLAG